MKKVTEIMVPARKVVAVSPEDSLQDAAKRLSRAGVGGAPVVVGSEKKVVGVISESDILRFAERAEAELGEKKMVNLEHAVPTRVKELMSKNLVTVGPEATLDQVIRLMVAKKVNRVVVVDKKRLLRGLVARADILRAALEV